MNFIKKIFCRRKQFKPQPKQLRIDGCKTVMTAAPDDSELAAQALLESRIYGDKSQRQEVRGQRRSKHKPSDISHQPSDQPHDAAYYQQLSEKIRTAHEQERRAAMRYVSYVEEQLSTPLDHREGQGESPIATLEYGLFKHQDAAEREGGELLKRWQKCLAEFLLLDMKTKTNTDLTDDADEHQPSDI